MATSRGAHGTGALESLAGELARDADPFEPTVESTARHLPGRRRGAAPASNERPSGGAAVLLDVGTSRRGGFTHVLWVSESAESLLGATALDTLDECLATVAGVRSVEWEGIDHLHLNAPGRDHAELLRAAREVVANLLT